MPKYAQFEKSIEFAVNKFKSLQKNKRVRVVSHLDADGICACAILLKALNHENRNYSISIVQQLNEKILKSLCKEDYECFFFTDLGAGQLKLIVKHMKNKTVFILDHHTPDKIELPDNIIHVNPHLNGIDGGEEISGSGVVFFFTNKLNSKNEMAHIALIGAIGDVQENKGFRRLNKEILNIAIKTGKISVKKGLRVFGMQTKPLHKTLEYCADPYIPGVSGSVSGAIKFLKQIGINPKNKKSWNKMIYLNDEEKKKLIAGVIKKRSTLKNPHDVMGNIYLLNHEDDECPLKDAKEFATLLNACGRLNKASIGIGVCLNDKNAKAKALVNADNYKKEIIRSMNWYNTNKSTKNILIEEGFIIINAKENILVSIIGTIASIISKSHEIKEKTFVMSLARNPIDETTKVSLRISERNTGFNLREIMDTIINNIDGAQSGGHASASGAIVPTKNEDNFINEAKRILRLISMQEII